PPPASRPHRGSPAWHLQFEYCLQTALVFQSPRAPVRPSATSLLSNTPRTFPRCKLAPPEFEAAPPSFRYQAESSEACHLVWFVLPEKPAGRSLAAPVRPCIRRRAAYLSPPAEVGRRCTR